MVGREVRELVKEQVERELELDVRVCDNELVHGEVQVVERAAKIEGVNFAFNLALFVRTQWAWLLFLFT